jgi:hypothetical protein
MPLFYPFDGAARRTLKSSKTLVRGSGSGRIESSAAASGAGPEIGSRRGANLKHTKYTNAMKPIVHVPVTFSTPVARQAPIRGGCSRQTLHPSLPVVVQRVLRLTRRLCAVWLLLLAGAAAAQAQNQPTNLPPLSVQRLTNGLIQVAWPTQAVNAVLQTASTLSGPWSVVGQINPLPLPRYNQRQFFRLAAAPSSSAYWDLDGDGTPELAQYTGGLSYPTATGWAAIPARAWAVIQRNNGFIVYVDTQGSGHIDYGYLLADLNGNWVFDGPGEVQLIPAPQAVCGKDCAPNFRLLASVWTGKYEEPSGTAARNTLTNQSPGTYVTLKVDGDCGGICGDCGGGMQESCVKSVQWNIQPNNPAPGSGYSPTGDRCTFVSDRPGNNFQVTVTVTCTGCGKQTTQQIHFSIGW